MRACASRQACSLEASAYREHPERRKTNPHYSFSHGPLVLWRTEASGDVVVDHADRLHVVVEHIILSAGTYFLAPSS